MVQRKNLILLVAGLVLALLAVLVIAAHSASNIIDAPVLLSPSSLQNISGSQNTTMVGSGNTLLNATFDLQSNQSLVINVTFHFLNTTNSTTRAPGYFVLNTTIQNSSANQTLFQNLTFNSRLLADGRYNVTVSAVNGTVTTNQSFTINNSAVGNIIIDNTPPNVTAEFDNTNNVHLLSGANFSLRSGNQTFNVTIFDQTTDLSNIYFRFSNASNDSGNDFSFNITDAASFNVSGNVTVVNATANNTLSVRLSYNVSALTEGKQIVRVFVNDTVSNVNNSIVFNFTVDKTVPGVSASTSAVTSTGATLTATINETGAANCTYGGSEVGGGSVLSGTALTGNGAMTSFTATLTLVPSTAYSITVNCTDFAGNSNTATTSVTAAATASSSNGGGGSGGSGGGVSANVQGQVAKEIWTSINAGETATVEVANGALGVTEVSFSVPATVYGAWIQVAKKDSLPSSVSAFDGKVYRNFEITTGQALKKEGAFTDAVVKFKVEKAWLSENGVTMSEVALYRFADEWKQLETQVGEDDGTYVHYSAKTPAFSYFVVGQMTGAEPSLGAEAPAAEGVAPVEAPAESAEAAMAKESKKAWLLGLLAALVVVVAVVVYMRRRR